MFKNYNIPNSFLSTVPAGLTRFLFCLLAGLSL
jgi:hypothetical protein